MLLGQQDVALGQESFPELSLRCADVDGKDPDVVFPPSLRCGRPVVCRRRTFRGGVGGGAGGSGFAALGAWTLTSRRALFLYFTTVRLGASPVCSVRPGVGVVRLRAEVVTGLEGSLGLLRVAAGC